MSGLSPLVSQSRVGREESSSQVKSPDSFNLLRKCSKAINGSKTEMK